MEGLFLEGFSAAVFIITFAAVAGVIHYEGLEDYSFTGNWDNPFCKYILPLIFAAIMIAFSPFSVVYWFFKGKLPWE